MASIEDQVEDLAKEMINNHAKFNSFAWFDAPEDKENWCIYDTHNRDSGLLEILNYEVMKKELEIPEFENDLTQERHSHWTVGWIECYCIRVRDSQGKITPAFRKFAELFLAMEDYPVLDESDYSEREYEATLENLENELNYVLRYEDWVLKERTEYSHNGKDPMKDVSIGTKAEDVDNLAGIMFSWFWDNDQSAVENRDDQGGYPSEEQIRNALEGLGFSMKEED